MKAHYSKEIDYEKTMGQLKTTEGENEVIIPASSFDIANIRTQVARYAQNKFPGMKFTVNKCPEGAKIIRVI